MKDNVLINDEVYQFLLASSLRESSEQRELRELTNAQEAQHANMMTSPEQAQFLNFLVGLIKAKYAIEVGVFTGYGSLAIAKALPDHGELIACNISSEWPSIGEPFWQKAGVRHKIQLKIAPAIHTLQTLIDEGRSGEFDFIFIDADKINYAQYYELSLQLLRGEGLMILDNVLLIGKAFVHEKSNPATRAVNELCYKIREDCRVSTSLVPIGEGMLLIRKN